MPLLVSPHFTTNLCSVILFLSAHPVSPMYTSADFSEKIRKMELEERDRMVSFNVVSLFTRIHVDDALDTLSGLLLSDDGTTILATESAISRHSA